MSESLLPTPTACKKKSICQKACYPLQTACKKEVYLSESLLPTPTACKKKSICQKACYPLQQLFFDTSTKFCLQLYMGRLAEQRLTIYGGTPSSATTFHWSHSFPYTTLPSAVLITLHSLYTTLPPTVLNTLHCSHPFLYTTLPPTVLITLHCSSSIPLYHTTFNCSYYPPLFSSIPLYHTTFRCFHLFLYTTLPSTVLIHSSKPIIKFQWLGST